MTFVVLDLDKVYDAKGVFPWSCIATCFLGQTSVWLRLSVVNFNWRAKKDKESNINNMCVKDHIAKGRTRGLWRGDSWLLISSYFFFFLLTICTYFLFFAPYPPRLVLLLFLNYLWRKCCWCWTTWEKTNKANYHLNDMSSFFCLVSARFLCPRSRPHEYGYTAIRICEVVYTIETR